MSDRQSPREWGTLRDIDRSGSRFAGPGGMTPAVKRVPFQTRERSGKSNRRAQNAGVQLFLRFSTFAFRNVKRSARQSDLSAANTSLCLEPKVVVARLKFAGWRVGM